MAVCGLVLAGCSAEPELTPTLTPTATDTTIPTATIIWFPPTDTPTALPVQPATQTFSDLTPGKPEHQCRTEHTDGDGDQP